MGLGEVGEVGEVDGGGVVEVAGGPGIGGLSEVVEDGVEVVEAKVITDRESGRSRGFGFVTVATPEMAQKAIDAMNEKEVEGRKIFVNISRPKTEDSRRDRN